MVCGVYASVYHDADAYVPLTPVRGGVLDAPRSVDEQAYLKAPRRIKWCAGGARGIAYVGWWMKAGAPWATRVKAVTPNRCV